MRKTRDGTQLAHQIPRSSLRNAGTDGTQLRGDAQSWFVYRFTPFNRYKEIEEVGLTE